MIILSCGHQEDDFDKHYDIIIQSESRECEKALAYMVVCACCKQMYADAGLLFETETAASTWLMEKE